MIFCHSPDLNQSFLKHKIIDLLNVIVIMCPGYINQKPQLCWQILYFLTTKFSVFTSTSFKNFITLKLLSSLTKIHTIWTWQCNAIDVYLHWRGLKLIEFWKMFRETIILGLEKNVWTYCSDREERDRTEKMEF